MTITVMSMATKSSDLDDQISGANLQTTGHTLTSPHGQKDLEETGASGGSPSHSQFLSAEWQQLPGHPRIQYYL